VSVSATFAYTVRCVIDDPDVAAEWIAWMRDTHLAEVVEAGATSAVLVRLDGEPITCEARYAFESREAWERYDRDRAPALRAKGLEAFPLSRGLRYERTTGEVVAACHSPPARKP
jgi:hypothetical protein